MFFLLIVLLNTAAVPGMERTYRIGTYDTQEECQLERNRIGFEMAEAYPYENDFIIVCKLDPKKET